MTDTDLADVWARSLDGLAELHVQPSQLAWLKLTRPLGLVENTALIATPNAFVKEQLETRLRPLVTHALSRELGRPIQLAVTVDPSTAAPPEPPPGPPASPLSPGSPGHNAQLPPMAPQHGIPAAHDARSVPQPQQPSAPPVQHGVPQHTQHGVPQFGAPQHGMPTLDVPQPQPQPYSYQATAYPPTAYQGQPQPGHSFGNLQPGQDSLPAPAEPPHQQPRIPQHAIQQHAVQQPAMHQPAPPAEAARPSQQHQQHQQDQSPLRPTAARLNPKYTFETFVIGSSNRFAHAAAVAVAEAPAKAYNPLFIYGDSGLGKTHLLHAIGHYAQTLYSGLKVRYVSSEEFTNDFINMIRDGKQDGFRRRYRDMDVLLVDDIQFLENKEGTQEEFFHTFNTLHNASKQIVISSDRAPKRLVTLEDRLRSRFDRKSVV